MVHVFSGCTGSFNGFTNFAKVFCHRFHVYPPAHEHGSEKWTLGYPFYIHQISFANRVGRPVWSRLRRMLRTSEPCPHESIFCGLGAQSQGGPKGFRGHECIDACSRAGTYACGLSYPRLVEGGGLLALLLCMEIASDLCNRVILVDNYNFHAKFFGGICQ